MSDYICLGTENFVDIPDTDVDFKSPIDEYLMTTIRDNQRNNKCKAEEALVSGGGAVDFKVNGNFNLLDLGGNPLNGVDLDGAFISKAKQLTRCALFVLSQGDGGNMTFDVKRSVYHRIPIYKILEIFSGNTQSVARGSASFSTQTITNSEATQNTQLIDFPYAAENIENIQQIQGSFLFRINFDPDTVVLDPEVWEKDKYIVIGGATAGGNNGTFQIRELNECDGVNVIIENALGVSEIPTGATAKPNYARYNFTAVIPSNFVEGESATFAGHTDGTNDGTLEIFKVNLAGNNIVVAKGAVALVEQGGIAGTVNSLRWKYSFLNIVPDAFGIGEASVFASHTNAANDGSLIVLSKNVDAGFNVIVYNTAGVAQGGIAGTIDTNRFVYALDSDPAGFFEIGDTAVMASHTAAANDGNFVLVDVKYLGNDNIVVYNAAGVFQAGIAGTIDHLQKAITFREDQSAFFDSGKSNATTEGTSNVLNDGTFEVVDVNRIAISAFNIIVEMSTFLEQLGDAGCVSKEVRSIFTDGEQTVLVDQDKQIEIFENNINTSILQENTALSLDVTEAPNNMTTISVDIE